jgi:hypothetical protein
MHLPVQLNMQSPNSNQTLLSGSPLVESMMNTQNAQSRSFATDDSWTPGFTQNVDWSYPELPDNLHFMLSEFCAF